MININSNTTTLIQKALGLELAVNKDLERVVNRAYLNIPNISRMKMSINTNISIKSKEHQVCSVKRRMFQ